MQKHGWHLRLIVLFIFVTICAAQLNKTVLAQSTSVGGYPMPTLEDEINTYKAWGWTWDPSIEPNFPGDPSYTVVDPDIHGDTEGDDLWSYLMMYQRTGQQGYFDRAAAWARYFKEDYGNCVGGQYSDFCYDLNSYGADHLYGWGLVDWYLFTGDTAALAEAEQLAETVEQLHSPGTVFGCYLRDGCMQYGVRAIGRHLNLVTRVAEVTGKQRWLDLRDQLIDMIMNSQHFNAQYGSYFRGEWSTDQTLGAGAYAAGDRIQSAFELGVLDEALAQAYRVTGRTDIRDRLITMARYVDKYGLDPTYQYTAKTFGIVNGQLYHSYAQNTPVTFWDPVYTTDLVNTLVRGYKLTGDLHLYDRAKYFFNRGTKGLYGEPIKRGAPDDQVDHFIDTEFSSSSGNFYLDHNKGELQYTYLLFEGAGDPPVSVESSASSLPDAFTLEQNYPNPFNPETNIQYTVGQTSHVEIKVYNLMGQLIRTLVDKQQPSGSYSIQWSGHNDAGRLVSSGLYFVKMKAGNFTKIRKMAFIK